jgi:hypothetical protein
MHFEVLRSVDGNWCDEFQEGGPAAARWSESAEHSTPGLTSRGRAANSSRLATRQNGSIEVMFQVAARGGNQAAEQRFVDLRDGTPSPSQVPPKDRGSPESPPRLWGFFIIRTAAKRPRPHAPP